jgi:hypothetical protein
MKKFDEKEKCFGSALRLLSDENFTTQEFKDYILFGLKNKGLKK